jgi:Flp pilus assembly protein TadD
MKPMPTDSPTEVTRSLHEGDRQNSSFLKTQGYLYEQRGEPEKAISCYREALDWDERDRYAVRRIAELRARKIRS